LATLVPPASKAQFEIGIVPAQPALAEQYRNLRGNRRQPDLARADEHMAQPRRQSARHYI